MDWQEAGWKPKDLLGQEEVKERKFSKKLGYTVEKKVYPYIEEVHYEAAFVTETYHGGRNEQFAFGISPEGLWRDHDLSSAYTTAMSLIGKPSWGELERLSQIGEVDPKSLSYYSVDFEFPDLQRLRRDLTRAFVKHKAGFDIERGNRKIGHKDFAQTLENYGIPCAVSDIENANRAEFIQKQTPPTARVRDALHRLKEECFPNLEIDSILVDGWTEWREGNP